MLLQRRYGSGIWDQVREMELLKERLTDLVNSTNSRTEFPPVRVWTSEAGALVETELPGLSEDEIELLITNDVLTIKGAREPEQAGDTEKFYRQERGYGQFSRSLQMSFKIDADKVRAQLHEGILLIELPKAEIDRAKRISVKSE